MSILSEAPRVAVVTVNYNTAELLSHLLITLFRVLGRERFTTVVIVDNASTDWSVALIRKLVECEMAEAILNRTQQYHGHGLNQAIDYLAICCAIKYEPPFDFVWILDSDTIVLRPDVLDEAISQMTSLAAHAAGQVQYDALREGYAHPCCLLLDVRRTIMNQLARFDDTGAPATSLNLELQRRGTPPLDFPFMSAGYVLHLGRGTRARIVHDGEIENRHFLGAQADPHPHYHSAPFGAHKHQEFCRLIESKYGSLSPSVVAKICSENGALDGWPIDRDD